MAVSAPGEDGADRGLEGEGTSREVDSGAVYLFEYDGASWNQVARIKASNTGTLDAFGGTSIGFDERALALDADTLIVGASREDSISTGINGPQNNDFAPDSGAVYVRRVR